MRLLLQQFRSYSTKYATTLNTAGKLGKFTNLVENPHDLYEKDTVKFLLPQYGYAVRDSLPRSDPELYDVIKRFDDVCYHTGPERELCSTVLCGAYKLLELPENLNPENLKMVAMFSWAFEYLVTVGYLSDDIMDENGVRWKKPCWHTLPNIGLSTMLDVRQMTMGAFTLLRKYLKDHPSYKHLYKVFSDFLYSVYLGQTGDYIAATLFKRTRDPNLLSMQQFLATARNKTGRPAFCFPVLAAVYLAKLNPQIFFNSEHIFESFGFHFQAQNDMRDLCGDFNNYGKPGTDITGAKCTWITSTVLQFGSEELKKVLIQNYGREERECHEKLYDSLKEFGIVERYRNYTKELIKECNEHANTMAHPGIGKTIKLLVEQYLDVNESFYL